ncbi:MAG: tetratricopeptide repeat protein [Sphingobacteriaceae bacterium]|nr:tetratricopeptide repeat protein [Sphingobacteriaceae bacterium]
MKKLIFLAEKYQKLNIRDSALNAYHKSFIIAEKNKRLKDMALIYAMKGNYLRNLSDFLASNQAYSVALKYCELEGDKRSTSYALNYIASNFDDLGELNLALEYFMKSLKIKEELSDKKGISTTYNGLGSLFMNKKSYDKAIFYYSESLKIKEELKDKKGMAISLNNLGNAHSAKKEFDKAFEYYLKAMKLKEEAGDKRNLTSSYANLGVIYKERGEYDKALEYYQKAINNDVEHHITSGLVGAYSNIVNVYLIQNKTKEAKETIEIAAKIANQSGTKADKIFLEETRMRLDTTLGNFKDAFFHQSEAYALEKSVIKQQNSQSVAELLTKYESQKKEQQIELLNKDKALQIAELDKQNAILQKNQQNLRLLEHENKINEMDLMRQKEELEKKNILAENQEKNIALLNKDKALTEALSKQNEIQLKQQRNVLYFVSGGAILIFILLGVSYRGYIQKKKNNLVLAEQKREVEQQKALVEAKQKEILDSIKYARRIQTSLMPTEKFISKYLENKT